VVESAFSVSKGIIELRLMFHFTPKRIEAHVTICFIAYLVYKVLERILMLKKIKLSVGQVLRIAKTMTTITVRLPKSGEVISKVMLVTPKQRTIALYIMIVSYVFFGCPSVKISNICAVEGQFRRG